MNLHINIAITAEKLKRSEDAYYNLNFGAARRTRMIWSAFRQLKSLAPPNRTTPMLHDDAFEVSRALNDIYIHTRGAMDNYAWAILAISGMQIGNRDVSIFSARFQRITQIEGLSDISLEFSGWNQELKNLRDPVAHRIPLSVSPTTMDEDDVIVFNQIYDKYTEAVREFAYMAERGNVRAEMAIVEKSIDELYAKLQNIGRFYPIIVHDPKQGGTKIYPTVPNDIGRLTVLCAKLNRILETAIG